LPKRIRIHSWAYFIEGFTATMIAELVCIVPYKGDPNADLARSLGAEFCAGDLHITAVPRGDGTVANKLQ